MKYAQFAQQQNFGLLLFQNPQLPFSLPLPPFLLQTTYSSTPLHPPFFFINNSLLSIIFYLSNPMYTKQTTRLPFHSRNHRKNLPPTLTNSTTEVGGCSSEIRKQTRLAEHSKMQQSLQNTTGVQISRSCSSFQELSLNNNKWIILDSNIHLQPHYHQSRQSKKKPLLNQTSKNFSRIPSSVIRKNAHSPHPHPTHPHKTQTLFSVASDLQLFAEHPKQEKKNKPKIMLHQISFTQVLSGEIIAKSAVFKKQNTSKKAKTTRMSCKIADLDPTLVTSTLYLQNNPPPNPTTELKKSSRVQPKQTSIHHYKHKEYEQQDDRNKQTDAEEKQLVKIKQQAMAEQKTQPKQQSNQLYQKCYSVPVEKLSDVIAYLYDPISLLEIGSKETHYTENPYQQFPLWIKPANLQLETVALATVNHNETADQKMVSQQYIREQWQKKSIVEQAQQLQQNQQPRTISPQHYPLEQGHPQAVEEITNQLAQEDRVDSAQQHNPHPAQHHKAILSLQDKLNLAEHDQLKQAESIKNHIQLKAQSKPDKSNHSKQRSLTTKETENLLTNHLSEQCFAFLNSQRPKQSQPHTQQPTVLPTLQTAEIRAEPTKPKQQSKLKLKQPVNQGKEFEIRSLFQGWQNMHFINIVPSEQTALFPLHLSTPVYIKHNPQIQNTLYSYRNQELVSMLNLFLKVQPKQIQQMFPVPHAHHYYCRLYHQLETNLVTVDGLFPFSSNYYPLYGSVQQYIWFCVLIKSIAKLKNSYKLVQQLTFNQIYKMITNKSLASFREELQQQPNGIKYLRALLKRSKNQQTFLIAIKQGCFYKIESVAYVRSPSQKQQEVQAYLLNGTNSPALNDQQLSYKTLDTFLSKRKMQIGRERINRNSWVRLVGVDKNLKVCLRELEQEFQLYCTSSILDL